MSPHRAYCSLPRRWHGREEGGGSRGSRFPACDRHRQTRDGKEEKRGILPGRRSFDPRALFFDWLISELLEFAVIFSVEPPPGVADLDIWFPSGSGVSERAEQRQNRDCRV